MFPDTSQIKAIGECLVIVWGNIRECSVISHQIFAEHFSQQNITNVLGINFNASIENLGFIPILPDAPP